MAHQGLFITFEGGEGAGKSTQIRLLAERLAAHGLIVTITREPGGSPAAEALRQVLLSGAAEPFGTAMEALLFAAARQDHVATHIRPALDRGEVVLCDRFMDSSRVYQGRNGDLAPDFVDRLQRIAVNDTLPDITLILDLPAAMGLARAKARAGVAGETGPDRFEREALAIHERRREGFLAIAAAEPQRCFIIDATADIASIADSVLAIVSPQVKRLAGEGSISGNGR